MEGKIFKSKWRGKEGKMGRRKWDVWVLGMSIGTSGYYQLPLS